MFNKRTIALAFACALSGASAYALPTITFSGVANGANVADFYNGGTDSFGYSGVDYGIHFNGVVANNVAGPYVKGRASMSFAANLFGANTPYYILFNAALNGVDGGYSTISGTPGDAVWVTGNANPFCNSEATCGTNFSYIHPSQMGGYAFYTDGSATSVAFSTDRLDNITFVLAADVNGPIRPPTLQGTAELDRDIPEPASAALLGIGVLGLAAMRRRKATK